MIASVALPDGGAPVDNVLAARGSVSQIPTRYRNAWGFRWNHGVRKKEICLGAETPWDLTRLRRKVEREIWEETRFPLFDSIRSLHSIDRDTSGSWREEEAGRPSQRRLVSAHRVGAFLI